MCTSLVVKDVSDGVALCVINGRAVYDAFGGRGGEAFDLGIRGNLYRRGKQAEPVQD